MKKLFLICAIAFTIKSNAQSKEGLFDKTCNQIVTHLAKGQFQELNKYVKPEIGIYYIVRPGAMDAIGFKKKIDTNMFPRNSYTNHLYIADELLLKQIHQKFFTRKDKLPKHSCDEPFGWSAEGIFTDIKKKFTPLSNIINGRNSKGDIIYELNKEEVNQYEKIAKQAKKVEAASRKIVVTKLNLAFYLYYDNNEWWISIIDVAEATCDV